MASVLLLLPCMHIPSSKKVPTPLSCSFKCGAPLVFNQSSSNQRSFECKAKPVSIRCEESAKPTSSGLDVWLGRLAMMGFASAIIVEVTTGKGLLQNFGLSSPLPTVALAVTGLVGVLTAVFIFQSASRTE